MALSGGRRRHRRPRQQRCLLGDRRGADRGRARDRGGRRRDRVSRARPGRRRHPAQGPRPGLGDRRGRRRPRRDRGSDLGRGLATAERVAPVASEAAVGAGGSIEQIEALVPAQQVDAGSSEEPVGAAPADDRVGAGPAARHRPSRCGRRSRPAPPRPRTTSAPPMETITSGPTNRSGCRRRPCRGCPLAGRGKCGVGADHRRRPRP